MRRRFFTLDVFTSRRFAGNPLAVVLDANGLDEASMQMIAREFNLAETVFLLPAWESSHRARPTLVVHLDATGLLRGDGQRSINLRSPSCRRP